MNDRLLFPSDNCTLLTFCVEGKPFACRAWTGLCYCAQPAEDIQRLNLYAPACYFEGDSINGYRRDTAPIFMPNQVGGYMPGQPGEPAVNENGQPNTVLAALMHGYVVACAGIRGRSTETGKAPALIVDMKAAVRYLRRNAGRIPGNTERMITSGTSAGGALSALAGATGNEPAYMPWLEAIGAAQERDDIFAASCYCPIVNLENADAAYEWQFSQERSFRSWQQEGEIDHLQAATAQELKQLFPAYLNGLGLTDGQGRALTLEADGSGSFKDWVISWVMASAQREVDTHATARCLHWLAVPGSAVEEQPFLTIENGRVTGLDWPAFVHAITRMKMPPAFDALDLSTCENDTFAAQGVPRHFTAYSHAHSIAGGSLADAQTIRLMNPMQHIGSACTAAHWRIRHGSHDRDTSLAVPVMLATALRMHGCSVDFHLPWGLPHSGDYDLPELFAWIDRICQEQYSWTP